MAVAPRSSGSYGESVTTYEGLYRYENGWRCVSDCVVQSAPREVLRDTGHLYTLYVHQLRATYPPPPPYYWAGLWYWGVDNQWHLAQQDSNYL